MTKSNEKGPEGNALRQLHDGYNNNRINVIIEYQKSVRKTEAPHANFLDDSQFSCRNPRRIVVQEIGNDKAEHV